MTFDYTADPLPCAAGCGRLVPPWRTSPVCWVCWVCTAAQLASTPKHEVIREQYEQRATRQTRAATEQQPTQMELWG